MSLSKDISCSSMGAPFAPSDGKDTSCPYRCLWTTTTPSTGAFPVQSSSRDCRPAPDLVFLKLVVPHVLFSGGVSFSQASAWGRPLCFCNPGVAETPDMLDEGETFGALPPSKRVSHSLRVFGKPTHGQCICSSWRQTTCLHVQLNSHWGFAIVWTVGCWNDSNTSAWTLVSPPA